MAWISVHEQVLGGKLRSLAKEIGCSQNEALGLLIRLWLWGINNADKEGRIIGADKADVAEVLTIGIDTKISPESVVEAMIKTAWIDWEDYLFIHDWEVWQKQWYKAIEVRERDANRKREERKAKKESIKHNAGKGMEENLPSPKLKIPNEEQQKSKSEDDYPDNFKEFWEIYPKKVGKGEAYKKYKARINSGWSSEELLQAARNYALKIESDKTDKQYIKHPKTFLSDTEPFVDYLSRKKENEIQQSDNEDDPYEDWR